jgi:hypothetical protein
MSGNRLRLLSDVLSLDAWHSPMRTDRASCQVCVELTFKEGRLGGEDEDFPFTFRLSLKRALMTIRLEEPLDIVRDSVARNIPDSQVHQTRLRAVRDGLIGSIGGEAKISPDTFVAALNAKLKTERTVQNEEETSFIQILPPILAVSEPRGRREYSWTLEPTFMPALRGQPWDPVESPRLSARYDPRKISKVTPAISVRIECALEDLLIQDINPKDRSLQETISNILPGDTRLAAAKQHIKHVLRVANLEPGGLDNRFSRFLVASVLAAVEP